MQEIVDKKKPRTLSKRVEALEAEVEELKRLLEQQRPQSPGGEQPFKHNWEKTFGIFKDDPTHEEAVRLGRAWRLRQPKCCYWILTI